MQQTTVCARAEIERWASTAAECERLNQSADAAALRAEIAILREFLAAPERTQGARGPTRHAPP